MTDPSRRQGDRFSETSSPGAGARGLPDYLTQSSPRTLRRCFKALRAKRHVVLLWIATWQIEVAGFIETVFR
ncbi:MAG TPA: hypothetical protein VJN94_17955, partial [Candidatus Binataceae bacterium]|nr:hypothetical protein [Candidatus Binataceae bacterium]